MSRVKGAPPPGWRPTVKGKTGVPSSAGDVFGASAVQGTSVILPDGGAAVHGSRFRSPPGASAASALAPASLGVASGSTANRPPAAQPTAQSGSASDSLRQLLGPGAASAPSGAADYGRWSAKPSPSSRPPGVDQSASCGGAVSSSARPQGAKPDGAEEKPGWGRIFDDLDDDEQAPESPSGKRGPAAPQSFGGRGNRSHPGGPGGPDWDSLLNRLEGGKPQAGASRAGAGYPSADRHLQGSSAADGFDYGALFDGSRRQEQPQLEEDDDEDLPELVDQNGQAQSQPLERPPVRESLPPPTGGRPEEDEAERKPPPQRLVFDLDSHLVDICSEWQKYGMLGHFNLSGLADEGVTAWGEKIIPKGILNLADFRKHGVELDLSDTSVVASGFQQLEEFATAIKRDGTVTTLRLERAKLGNAGASWIAGALMRNSTLTELMLSGNGLGDEGVDSIAAVLDSSSKLRVLDLSDNRIGSSGARHLAAGVARSRALLELNLSSNNISDEGVERFLEVVDVAARPVAALKILDVTGNTISRRSEERLLSAFQRGITGLKTLRVQDSDRSQGPAAEDADGKPERFTVICTQRGIEIRSGRAGKRAQVSWEQDGGDVEVVLKRSELRKSDARNVTVRFSHRRLAVLVGDELLMDIELFGRVRPDDCAWTVGDGFLQVVLAKAESIDWEQLTAG